MNDTTNWAVRAPGLEDAVATQLMSEKEAQDVVTYLRATGECPDAEAYDRLADFIARYPVGMQVVHTELPQVGIGTVAGGHRVVPPFCGAAFPDDQLDVDFPGRAGCWLAAYIAPAL